MLLHQSPPPLKNSTPSYLLDVGSHRLILAASVAVAKVASVADAEHHLQLISQIFEDHGNP